MDKILAKLYKKTSTEAIQYREISTQCHSIITKYGPRLDQSTTLAYESEAIARLPDYKSWQLY